MGEAGRYSITAFFFVISVFFLVVSPPTRGATADSAEEKFVEKSKLFVVPSIETVREIFPAAESLTDNRDGSWRVRDISGNHLGDAISGSGESAGITGYAGPTPLMMGIEPDGTVKGLHLLPNHETPGFQVMFSAGPFLKTWIGLKPFAALTAEVDTVSGATMSTTSIRDTVRALLEEFLKKKVRNREE